MDVRQQLRGRGYASSEVHHEALVECVRSCGVRRAVSRDTIYTACERANCEACASAEDAPFEFGRHGLMPGWNDTRRTFKIAGASAARRTERRHEPAGDDEDQTRRAR